MARSVPGEWRLIPYLQRHEFEALVLACLDELRALLGSPDDQGVAALQSSLGTASPEDVNDGEETAPSKRLALHLPTYRKVLYGPMALELACEQRGLAAIRARCPRFGAWVKRLEALGHGADGVPV